MTAAPKLAGRVALVTGAARGIGEVTARLLAREGAHVVCVDHHDAAACVGDGGLSVEFEACRTVDVRAEGTDVGRLQCSQHFLARMSVAVAQAA